MSKQRKQYTEEFKATVALEAVKGEKSLAGTGNPVRSDRRSDMRMETTVAARSSAVVCP